MCKHTLKDTVVFMNHSVTTTGNFFSKNALQIHLGPVHIILTHQLPPHSSPALLSHEDATMYTVS